MPTHIYFTYICTVLRSFLVIILLLPLPAVTSAHNGQSTSPKKPGYELGASFALFSYSLDYFARLGLEWLSLGAGAGAGPGAESGLTRFKQGWSTGVRTAYFCGRIFDEQKYQEIVRSRGATATEYFPAYRAGEFA